MNQELTYDNATKETIKNNIIICRNGNLKYRIPTKFNNDQATILYHAISIFHFLAFSHSTTYGELAEMIKKSYCLDVPQNMECYNILILADKLTK
jgi:hypothetical protein